MRVAAEVVGRPLSIRGPVYAVGERIMLDDADPAHREVLAADGWVRVICPHPASAVAEETVVAAPAAPPADKMLRGPAVGKTSKRRGRA